MYLVGDSGQTGGNRLPANFKIGNRVRVTILILLANY
jgi:hypothetical protein